MVLNVMAKNKFPKLKQGQAQDNKLALESIEDKPVLQFTRKGSVVQIHYCPPFNFHLRSPHQVVLSTIIYQ